MAAEPLPTAPVLETAGEITELPYGSAAVPGSGVPTPAAGSPGPGPGPAFAEEEYEARRDALRAATRRRGLESGPWSARRKRTVAARVHGAMTEAGDQEPGFVPLIRSTGRLAQEHVTWREHRLAPGEGLFVELSGACTATTRR